MHGDSRQGEDPEGGPQAQGDPHGSCRHCGTLPEGVLSPESLAQGRVTSLAPSEFPSCWA